MSKNIELKFSIESMSEFVAMAKKISMESPVELMQKDIFYSINKGRLKLRDENGIKTFIYYFRSNCKGERLSRYYRFRVGRLLSNIVEVILSFILGARGIVSKRRRVYFYKNSRIHCDSVLGLGEFGEFEVVMNGITEQEAREEVEFLRNHFCIKEKSLVSVSYSDMLF
ncbi:Adenylate cyclase, class 2 (thermophilic) [Hahella chejuensis KCTC 2396]|uniref:Adenylate cyclase, class 2 (Thermophilic) n=1 Tax=Hahella chejuensis (strain KCTC 2396) TaxID=349521 RepID=Q2S8K3_HAHCH|nr:class IV adenylate cyclase [Hahella chejuensis]ABC33021.1 Adenylate cyclase, class 2 (thermophilic) [Hahella chejuensis KCTC 2396]